MQGAARYFFALAILYAICGMLLGLSMSMSNNHLQMPTHAHTMVAGWLMSAVFAYFYHLFPAIGASRLAMIHFYLQAASGIILLISLFFVLRGNEALEPITAIGSLGFLAGMLLFAWNAMPVLRKA